MDSQASLNTLYRYRFSDAELDEARSELKVSGQVVALEPRALSLLRELLRHAGEVVTHEELIEEVWDGRPTVPNVIANAVTKLRKALGASIGTLIVNVPRVGYRLDTPVERTVVQAGTRQAASFAPGQTVPSRPDVRLERLLDLSLGSEVWLAHDVALGTQRVFKFATDGRRLSALKREATLSRVLRETLGERPDILYVTEWNFAELPFHLASEYGGQNLLEWAEGARHLTAMARTERLALFLQIAEAMAAAHGVGVLHKDIKPANVLITPMGERWQVRLADFGSGGLLDPTLLTQLGITRPGMLETAQAGIDGSSGTPLYFAPELIAGQPPSMRSDLYALGVLLYQMLIGDLRRPLAPGWERAIDDALLAGDIARATDVDPARRFSSVDELTHALRELEPRKALQAQQAAFEKEAQRSRQLATRARVRRPWILSTFAVLLIGLGAFAWQYRQALLAGAEARQQARYANSVNNFLIEDILRPADPGRSGKRDPAMSEVLKAASERLAQRDGLEPAVATILHTALAAAYQNHSDYSVAEAQYLKAIERGTPGNRHVLRAQLELARLLAVRGRQDEARHFLDSALAAAGPLELRDDAIPNFVYWAQGSIASLEHRLDEAAIVYEKALAWNHIQDVYNQEPETTRHALIIELADVYSRGNRAADAERVLTELLADNREGRLNASIRAKALLLLGRSQAAQQRHLQARQNLEQALAVNIDIYGPSNYLVHATRAELTPLLSRSGEHEAALGQAQQAYDGMLALLGPAHQVVWLVQQERASARFHAGDVSGAVEDWTQVHAGLLGQFGQEMPLVMGGAWRLAFALAELGRLDESEMLLVTINGDALDTATGDKLWPARVDALHGLILSRRGQLSQAEERFSTALPLLEAGNESRRYLDILAAARRNSQADNITPATL